VLRVSSAHGNRQKHESKNPIQQALIGHFHSELVKVVRELAPSEILDVGCGEGYTLEALRKGGIRCPMSGIDFSAEAIEQARKRVPDATFEVEDALVVAKAGRKFDLVVMTEVLEHIPSPERMLPVLEQIAGRYVVTSVPWEPFFRGLNFLRGKHVFALGNDPEHINHWGRNAFLRFMGERFAIRQAPLVFPWTLVATERR
jgi:SAM-dependent methyltransferase